MKKIFAFVLALSMLCAMTGCDKNEGSALTQESSTSTESLTGSTEDSSSTPSAPDSSSEESTGSASEPVAGQAEFDFDEAVKNITLFGNKISLPCTIADFGEDYSLGAKGTVFEEGTDIGDNRIMIDILYKEEIIGHVILLNCVTNDNLSDKTIAALSLGYPANKRKLGEATYKNMLEKMGYYTDNIKFDLGGLTFDSTKDEVKAKLGEPDETDEFSTSGDRLTYMFSDIGFVEFWFFDQTLVVIKIDVQ